jgi:hypothetical protein
LRLDAWRSDDIVVIIVVRYCVGRKPVLARRRSRDNELRVCGSARNERQAKY